LGDAVNLASRLEGQSKLYGVDIVIGEATQRAAPEYAALELDLIAVKGKHEAVRVFALIGDPGLAASDEFMAAARVHAAMLEHYRAQDWTNAAEAIEHAQQHCPTLSTTYGLYRERVAYFSEHPAAPDWNGVYVAVTK
jgi:adenylate cyclase